MISSSRSQSGLVLAAMWAASCFAAAPQTQQQSPRKSANQASTRGKQTFSSTCATCHGLDGRGAERGPNIAENPKVQRLSDAQIVHIIQNGVPGTGMPAFHTLEPGGCQSGSDLPAHSSGDKANRQAARRSRPRCHNFLRQGRMFPLPHGRRQRRLYCLRSVQLRSRARSLSRFAARSPLPLRPPTGKRDW